MPFSFPASPTVGQTSTQNGRQYVYAGNNTWELVAASGGLSWSSVPASATATGAAGQIAYDGDYLYVATAANTWERAALSTWSQPDQYFSNVSLLLHMNGSNGSTTFTDSSGSPKTPTVYAATISTAQSKFGGACGSFPNASAARLEYASSTAFGFGTGDFTIEMWTRANNATVGSVVSVGQYTDGITWRLSREGDGIYFSGTNYNWNPNDNLIPYGEWAHIALVRQGTTARIYVNGASVWSQSLGTVDLGSSRPLYVAAGGHYLDGGPAEGYDGFIDELRVTKGICRYPSGTAFTPPTAAFSDA